MEMFKRTKKLIFLFLVFLPIISYAQWNPANYGSTGLPSNNIYNIIRGVLMWLLAIFGFVAVSSFVISGIMYLTAAGNEDQQKKAKNQMYWSIVGVIVGLIGLVVLYAADKMLRAIDFF